MSIVLISYNAGNIRSVLNALQRLQVEAVVTNDHEQIIQADKVIFPGVGAAGSAMESLRNSGLDKVIPSLTQPVLGICVGMQLLCAHSEEDNTDCLNIVPVNIRRFDQPDLKVPQMGWNQLHDLRSPLFAGVEDGDYVYNVHSYFAEDSGYTIARCNYGGNYAAAIQKDNFYGVQFHTEKSAEVGDRIIKNFLNI